MSIYYATKKTTDGFGAQYQKMIETYIYCIFNNLPFVYKPFEKVEHNYDKDPKFIDKLEELINLKPNIINIQPGMVVEHLEYYTCILFFEDNIDLYLESEPMKFLKDCFWKNKKDVNPFRTIKKNEDNRDLLNIAVHIRRENMEDNGEANDRITTPNSTYLEVMNNIRKKYAGKEMVFHIYSQGIIEQFKELEAEDVLFYLNDDIVKTFIGMVSANILVISPSSFSYSAALISDGEIYYKDFWHVAKSTWNRYY